MIEVGKEVETTKDFIKIADFVFLKKGTTGIVILQDVEEMQSVVKLNSWNAPNDLKYLGIPWACLKEK